MGKWDATLGTNLGGAGGAKNSSLWGLCAVVQQPVQGTWATAEVAYAIAAAAQGAGWGVRFVPLFPNSWHFPPLCHAQVTAMPNDTFG